jgi:hypothetical protein
MAEDEAAQGEHLGQVTQAQLVVVRRRQLVPLPRPVTACYRRRRLPARGYLLSASDQ